MKKDAVISGDGLFRYVLTRSWAPERGRVVWALHNSSTADAVEDDATVRRVVRFTERLGHGEAVILNPMAYRTKDPKKLREIADPVGPENERWWFQATVGVPYVVVGWGVVHPQLRGYVGRMITWLRAHAKFMRCLGKTQEGHPRHPLYVRAEQPLLVWHPHGEAGRGILGSER